MESDRKFLAINIISNLTVRLVIGIYEVQNQYQDALIIHALTIQKNKQTSTHVRMLFYRTEFILTYENRKIEFEYAIVPPF